MDRQPKQPRRFNWMACSIIVASLACLGIVLAVGGFATIQAWLKQDQVVEVTSTPQIVLTEAPTIRPSITPQSVIEAVPFRSVVQIWAMYEENGDLEVGWTGSGTIISSDGYILTNAHVVLPDRFFPVDALIVALSLQEDRPPEPTYYAEVVQADEDLDVAVIRVTTDMDGNPLDHASLNLPAVPLGNSDELRLGDTIRIIGYPGIGGETITVTPGEVGGFTSEPGRGDRAFIKTSATISGGNSGGMAADLQGYIIGIPTQLGYGGDDQFVDCRVLADTNRDGVIDDDDSCVPTGGFINALRPITLAMPLIEAALRGEVAIIESSSAPQGELPTVGSVLFFDDFSDPGSGWDDFSVQSGSVHYVGGEYRIEVYPDGYYIWGNPYLHFTDVIISVDARLINSAGDGGYVVFCRYQDEDNFYALEVGEDGYFAIWKLQAGEFYTIVPWDVADVIPTDGSPITITAACVGDTLTLAVDGVVVAQGYDDAFSSGDVGLAAGTWENGDLAIAYDNFTVRRPE